MEKLVKNYLNTFSCYNLETGEFPGPVLTISRQAGCSAQRIAIKLSKILTGYSYMSDTKTEAAWEWVDKKVFSNHIIKHDDMLLSDLNAGSFLLKIRFRNIEAETFGIEILKGESGETVVGYDNNKKALYIDRTRSGKTAFHEQFASIEQAPLMLDDNALELEVLVDQALVEVFAKEGSVVITDQVFPESGWDAMQLFAEGGEASVEVFEVFIMR